MSRVRCDSSRSVSASRAGVIDTLDMSSGGFWLLAPDFKTCSPSVALLGARPGDESLNC
jgi:hypothetical protein